MNKIQFLLSFIVLIPFFWALAGYFIKNNQRLICQLSFALIAITLINFINIYYNYDGQLNSVSFINIFRNIDIGISTTSFSLILAFFAIIIWLVLAIYAKQYFAFTNDENFYKYKLFSTLIIGLILLIIFSKNLLSLFIFYQILIVISYIFSSHFTEIKNSKSWNYFIAYFLFSGFLMFLSMILTYKFAGNFEFTNSGILEDNASSKRYFLLLLLFIFSVSLTALIPIQNLFNPLYNLNSPMIITVLVMSYGFTSLLVLLKFIINIFGFELFTANSSHFYLSFFLNLAMVLNLIFNAKILFFQSNLKKMLISLFFNQLICAFFIFLVLNQSIDKFILTIISFTLSQTLIFLCFGNISLYLLRAKQKNILGISSNMRFTSIMLAFAFLNILGIIPAIGIIEKYLLLKNYLISHFNFNILVILANIALIAVLSFRILSVIFAKNQNIGEYDFKIAQQIDSNLSFITPSVIVALLMFLSFVFSSKITHYIQSFLS